MHTAVFFIIFAGDISIVFGLVSHAVDMTDITTLPTQTKHKQKQKT